MVNEKQRVYMALIHRCSALAARKEEARGGGDGGGRASYYTFLFEWQMKLRRECSLREFGALVAIVARCVAPSGVAVCERGRSHLARPALSSSERRVPIRASETQRDGAGTCQSSC